MPRRLLLAFACTCLLRAADPMPAFRPGTRILFQGDSITDGNRGRNADPNHILGHSYAFLIAAKFGAMLPERHLIFFNRGISGNTVADLAARWTKDTLELKPDILSILIGINDNSRQIPLDEFEKTYDQILAEAVAANPHLRIVLCEPFTLPVGRRSENFDQWSAGVQKRQEAVARLAAKYHAAVVHFQKVFDDAVKRAPAEYWIWDGIHPTYAGHQLMADEWERTVQQFFPE
jgi:lysophospholipase L1-like esterase